MCWPEYSKQQKRNIPNIRKEIFQILEGNIQYPEDLETWEKILLQTQHFNQTKFHYNYTFSKRGNNFYEFCVPIAFDFASFDSHRFICFWGHELNVRYDICMGQKLCLLHAVKKQCNVNDTVIHKDRGKGVKSG